MIGINFFLKVEAPTIVGRSTGPVGECIIASSESGNTVAGKAIASQPWNFGVGRRF